MIYSKIKLFCNNCGEEMVIEWIRLMGREYKVCSSNCIKEIELKRACSIMNSEYERNQ